MEEVCELLPGHGWNYVELCANTKHLHPYIGSPTSMNLRLCVLIGIASVRQLRFEQFVTLFEENRST